MQVKSRTVHLHGLSSLQMRMRGLQIPRGQQLSLSGGIQGPFHPLEHLHQILLGSLVDRAALPDGITDCVFKRHQMRLGEQSAASAALGPLTG